MIPRNECGCIIAPVLGSRHLGFLKLGILLLYLIIAVTAYTQAVQTLLEVLEHEKRTVLAGADSLEARKAVRVEVGESRSHQLTLLYDPHHNLEERIINEQFTA